MKFFKKMAIIFIATLSPTAFAQTKDSLVQELAENVYAVSLFNYTSLVVVGEEDVLISDTANSYRAKVLKSEIAKITDNPVKKIVLTHEHFDHVGGTKIFPDAEVIAHSNILEYEELDPLGMLPEVIHKTFEKSLTIEMGTTSVELHHFGAADGLAVAVIYLPKEKVAVSADMYVDEGLNPGVFLTDTNMLGSRALLTKLANWDLNYAINVHSKRLDLVPLVATQKFYDDLYDLVLPEIKAQLRADPSRLVPRILEMSETLKMPKYESWQNYQDLPVYIRKMSFAIIHGG
ncbi:Zn-dependent hydrolase [Photobacterium sanctipauli]|uniref:Zn-dependent hydrolase n=1 Tax=Photobacterium sanctipauli TaxID=1342794 RepID=A0A2T3NN72_9GAMM|nr:MBL fold metallo-hydrolase [Photobacterium sanctipauli]PSW16940.1 Zn-dependent hydrolase [Photobacterium sanctipauli]